MELKGYQRQVIQNLEQYLELLQEYKNTAKAFKHYWEDKMGVYNPLEGKGMEPYKNNIPKAVHLTVKVPTAGGKTFIAVNALQTIFSYYGARESKAVVWLVPWTNLLDQTLDNLRNPDHPYRKKLNTLFNHRVEVYEKKDLLQGSNFTPTTVKEQLTIIVMSFASLRARKKEDRKVFQENGQLAAFASQYKSDTHLLEEIDETALINVIRSLNPVLVVDESHNAESDLSIEMLKNLNPSFLLDLTATPKKNSNIISMVPAIRLKEEHMVKLPVIVYNHHDKNEVINSALHLQNKLERLAQVQEKKGGKYIRPIVLFQAQPKTKNDNTTFEKLKEQLLKLKIPEEQIKIKTANVNELKGIDLMDKNCPVRYIITINALKEGWDCPFAYILATLANKSSAVDVEQILGRVLRQPYVMKHSASMLNSSFVLTASSKFNDTLKNIVKGLQSSGFSEKDYRKKDVMVEQEKEEEPSKQGTLYPTSNVVEEEDITADIDVGKISYDPTLPDKQEPKENTILQDIEQMVEEENRVIEKQVEVLKQQSPEENLFTEMEDKIKRYRIKDVYEAQAKTIKLPQFFLDVKSSEIFGTGKTLLNSESLLDKFKLSTQDTVISFDGIDSELYKVDIDEDNEYRPAISLIDEMDVKDPLFEYILAKPKEKQILDVTHQLMDKIGNMFPIADQEIKRYIGRVLEQLNPEQLRDVLVKQSAYRSKIKKKIKELSDKYAETKFNEMIKINKIFTEENWIFRKTIVPKKLGSSIEKSLYEQEANMSDFEEKIIMNISSFSNIAFWHRNLVKGTGFAINGFKSNHYPDFILVTKSGKVILLEVKGGHLDGTDSAAKVRLGKKWEALSGTNYFYFMVFENKAIEGAYNLEKAKELLKQID